MINILVLATCMMVVSNIAHRSVKYDISLLAAIVAVLLSLLNLSTIIAPDAPITPEMSAAIFAAVTATLATLAVLLTVLYTIFTIIVILFSHSSVPTRKVRTEPSREILVCYWTASAMFYVSAIIAMILN